jgi:hypothetical protein
VLRTTAAAVAAAAAAACAEQDQQPPLLPVCCRSWHTGVVTGASSWFQASAWRAWCPQKECSSFSMLCAFCSKGAVGTQRPAPAAEAQWAGAVGQLGRVPRDCWCCGSLDWLLAWIGTALQMAGCVLLRGYFSLGNAAALMAPLSA